MLIDGDVRLRPAKLPDDIDLALEWYQDPELLYFSEGTSTPYDREQVERMYTSLAKNCELYIIEVKIGAEWVPIGDASLCEQSLPIAIGVGEFRSRGIGKRVLKMLISRARRLGREKLVVKGVYTYNERARHLYEGAGFKLTATVFDEGGTPQWQFELKL